MTSVATGSATWRWLPSGHPPWFGLDGETLRFLEVHQTRAVAAAGRTWRDLGDAVLLHSPHDREPFFNRLTAVRWPEDPVAFDRRLTEALALFATLDRRPYLWAVPGLTTPQDIVRRLTESGFVDLGGGHDMLLVRDPRASSPRALPAGATVERWHASVEPGIARLAADVALVISESFGMGQERQPGLEAELIAALRSPVFHACLLRIDDEPVAAGQRFTFDGASYLSSIGTRPGWRGRGFGALVTEALTHDSLAEGAPLVYLGVHAENDAAITLYRRTGFAILGGRSADLLLR
ncbi:MAG: GNAT family N-acetyltransferase [Candidatus Limnocylindrales bacterium]